MTEDLEPAKTMISQDLKAIRAYEVFDRLRQGETIPEIAESMGIRFEVAQSYVKELAKFAREQAKELTATAFVTADLRLNDLYKKTYELATDTLADHDVRIRALATCLAIQSKINDLHQVGRVTATPVSAWVNMDALTDAEIIRSAKLVGIPVPKEITG